MSTFHRFCAKARRAAECVSQKAGELVDSASRSVKLKSLEIRLDELYESLGRVIYRDLHTDDDLEEQKLELIAAIDALYDEIAVSAGERGHQMILPPERLAQLVGAEFVDLIL